MRARILADLQVVERERTFAGIVGETLRRLVVTYGFRGAVQALRNMNVIQGRLLPELASLNLSDELSRLAVPVRCITGERDPLVPAAQRTWFAERTRRPGFALTVAPGAGHMVHFDRPDLVRSVCRTA